MLKLNGEVCVWDKDQNDPTMSLTTHFMDPSTDLRKSIANLRPLSHPKITPIGSRLTQISETRSAKITGLDINSDIAQFNLYTTRVLTIIEWSCNANIIFI